MMLDKKLKIGVVFGGPSGEYDVSCVSANTIVGALLDAGYENVFPIGIAKDGRWYGPVAREDVEHFDAAGYADRELIFPQYPGGVMRNAKTFAEIGQIDVAFPIIHGSYGEDGHLQAFFDMCRIPYVGAGMMGSMVGMDKVFMRDILKAYAIPQTDYVAVRRYDFENDTEAVLDQIEDALVYPMFVKPSCLGSSVGISKVENRDALREGLAGAARYDSKLIVETGVNAREIPLDDPETMGIFCSAAPLGLTDDDPIVGKTGTIGIPEFGTGFTRQMLVDTQPKGFDILVRLSGFSHGTDVWLGNAKDLIMSGTATVNQTVGCRDDIMLYLISRGMDAKLSFKIMESVRKGKVKRGGFQDGWVETMQEHGVPEWYITSLSKIAYLFPKAHAVAYVMMAFRIAWFKVHEPLAFYSAYFYRRSQKDSFDADMMTRGLDYTRRKINELRNKPTLTAKEEDLLVTLEAVYEFNLRGFEFAPMSLYESDATKFLIRDGKLLPPFVAISGLGESAAWNLVACRAGGREFVSVEELSAACPKVSQTHLEQLRAMGALGEMPDSSQMSLF